VTVVVAVVLLLEAARIVATIGSRRRHAALWLAGLMGALLERDNDPLVGIVGCGRWLHNLRRIAFAVRLIARVRTGPSAFAGLFWVNADRHRV